MAIAFGKSASISIATHDFSPYVTSVTFEQDQDVLDATTYGNTAHVYGASLTSGKFTIQGLWDTTATVGSQAVLQALIGDSDGAAFIWGPIGTTTGNVKYSGTIIAESYTESAPVADLVTFSFTGRTSGAVTVGTF